MLIYHNWIDPATYTGSRDGGLVKLTQTAAFDVYAVRAVNGDLSRSACATCQVAAWDVTVDLWDVGDISSTDGLVGINLLDPGGAVATSPLGINIYDLGSQRSNLVTGNYTVWASASSNRLASFVAQDTSTGQSADNQWIHLEIPIPPTYSPLPGQDWWSLQYVTGPGTVAIDTVTVQLA
jgi:hypothetical protein